MKGTTKPKIHVVIKNVTKITDYKGKKYKYTLVTNPLVLMPNDLCIENDDFVWVMIDLFSKACTGNQARSIRDTAIDYKEYITGQLEELIKISHELNKKLYDNTWLKNKYRNEKENLKKAISYYHNVLNQSFSVKEFDFRIKNINACGWKTIKEKSQDIMGMYGKDNLEVAYKHQYKDKKSPLFTYKHRNKPYGVTSRFERNMLEFIDVISNDLPSYKKTKKAKVKAAKHNQRFQTKRQMERELIQDYVDTRHLMWEEICHYLDKDYSYGPWVDQYGMEEYDWWVIYHREDHYAFPGPSLGYYHDRQEGWLAYKPNAFDKYKNYDEYHDWQDRYFDWS